MKTESDLEYAVFLPLQDTVINDEAMEKGELVVFEKSEGDIEIKNSSEVAIDVIVFGGEKYNEPIVFAGPFVMNNHEEIAQAYRDFHAGNYGKIDYELKNLYSPKWRDSYWSDDAVLFLNSFFKKRYISLSLPPNFNHKDR